jgi:hypothetical protein
MDTQMKKIILPAMLAIGVALNCRGQIFVDPPLGLTELPSAKA